MQTFLYRKKEERISIMYVNQSHHVFLVILMLYVRYKTRRNCFTFAWQVTLYAASEFILYSKTWMS